MPNGLTTSERVERYEKLRHQDALMYATVSELGTVTVKCPYCLIHMKLDNPVDITKFVETDGKREIKPVCSKGHTLHFKTIDEWRETRQDAGLQARG